MLAVVHTDQLGACVRLCLVTEVEDKPRSNRSIPFRRVKHTTAAGAAMNQIGQTPQTESARSNDLRSQLASAGSVISVSVRILKFWHRFERVFCRSSQYQFIVFMFELADGDRHVVFADT